MITRSDRDHRVRFGVVVLVNRAFSTDDHLEPTKGESLQSPMLQVKSMRLRIRYGRTVGRKGISVVVTVVWAAVSSRWMGENGVNAKRKPKKPVQQHRAQSVFSRPARQFYGLTVRRGRSGRIGSAKHTVFFPFRNNFRTVPIRAVCPVVTLSENLIIKLWIRSRRIVELR